MMSLPKFTGYCRIQCIAQLRYLVKGSGVISRNGVTNAVLRKIRRRGFVKILDMDLLIAMILVDINLQLEYGFEATSLSV